MTNMDSTRSPVPWLLLPSRLVLFALVQALIALGFALAGAAAPWTESARWWVYSVAVTNCISIWLLARLLRREGDSLRALLRFNRATLWQDLGLTAVGFALAGPIASLPMSYLGEKFLGSYEAAVNLQFQPLPLWAVILGFLFPLTIGLAELPTYFGYIMPRLAPRVGGWAAWLIAALFLGLQHATLPLIFNGGFILWRALMYLPFALYIGLVIKLRPRLLPYMAVGHMLIDIGAVSVYFTR